MKNKKTNLNKGKIRLEKVEKSVDRTSNSDLTTSRRDFIKETGLTGVVIAGATFFGSAITKSLFGKTLHATNGCVSSVITCPTSNTQGKYYSCPTLFVCVQTNVCNNGINCDDEFVCGEPPKGSPGNTCYVENSCDRQIVCDPDFDTCASEVSCSSENQMPRRRR